MGIDVVWRPVCGFQDYEVSSTGLVRSWKPLRNYAKPPTSPRILKFGFDKNGYRKVRLYRDGVHDQRVCVLVCVAFHGPRPEGLWALHVNGKNDDDRQENLYWGSPSQNSADSRVHGTWVHGEQVNTAVLTEEQVREVKLSDESHSSLARRFGVTPGAIWHIRANRTWKHVE